MMTKNLPFELLSKIISFVKLGDGDVLVALTTCCLVCKSWLAVAQPELYSDITVRYVQTLLRFHRSLKTSASLGHSVRSLRVEVSCELEHELCSRFALDEILAECLEKTSQLEILELMEDSSRLYTDTVIKSISRLSELRRLEIERPHQFQESEDEEDEDLENQNAQNQITEIPNTFNPRLLLQLPSNIVDLALQCPSDDLCKLLPSICANLGREPTGTASHAELQDVELVDGRQVDRSTGLQFLKLALDHDGNLSTTIASLSRIVSPTLIAFSLRLRLGLELNKPGWIDFLSATRNLRHLWICCITSSDTFFFNDLRLTRLESLSVGLMLDPHTAWQNFLLSFRNFLSSALHLNSFRFRFVFDQKVSPDELIESILRFTTRATPNSSLHELELKRFSAISIDTFENLCQSAPELEGLAVKVPLEHKERVISALGKLKYMVYIELNGIELPSTGYVPIFDFQPFLDLEPSDSESD